MELTEVFALIKELEKVTEERFQKMGTVFKDLRDSIEEAPKKKHEFSEDHVRSSAKDATPPELKDFTYLCNAYGLDPAKKEIYFMKYGGKVSIITSRDGCLKIANENPYFDGIEGDAVYEGDVLTKRDDGSTHIVYGPAHLSFDKTKLTGAFSNVYRKDRAKATSVLVSMKDYDKGSQIWKQYPNAMILKVAEAMALKRAFAMSGLSTQEEMGE